MFKYRLSLKFLRHLCGTDIIILVLLMFYDLLSLFIPVAKISFTGILLILIILDLLLTSIKLINNFNFSSHR